MLSVSRCSGLADQLRENCILLNTLALIAIVTLRVLICLWALVGPKPAFYSIPE